MIGLLLAMKDAAATRHLNVSHWVMHPAMYTRLKSQVKTDHWDLQTDQLLREYTVLGLDIMVSPDAISVELVCL